MLALWSWKGVSGCRRVSVSLVQTVPHKPILRRVGMSCPGAGGGGRNLFSFLDVVNGSNTYNLGAF